MTIKEFAKLCACNPQTLRYYDKIDLLKPVQVSPDSGYRHYEPKQAVDFVKIKNLQAADFTIGEIKALLCQTDKEVYSAFDEKIARQEEKLQRIREIQKTYLAEKNAMEQIISTMTDYLLSQCRHPEVLRELGIDPGDAPAVLACLRAYLNTELKKEVPDEEITLTVNEKTVHGQEAVLQEIQSFTEENVSDTILLNTGTGHQTETAADPEPDFGDYDCVFEKQGWAHPHEFLDSLPPLEPGNIYCLWLRAKAAADYEDLSFPLFFLGGILYRQKLEGVTLNCAVTAAEGEENHFKLLRKREAGAIL